MTFINTIDSIIRLSADDLRHQFSIGFKCFYICLYTNQNELNCFSESSEESRICSE
jgi:hypothetical protein